MAYQDPTDGDYMADGSDDQEYDHGYIIVCDICGGECSRRGDDSIDYCQEDGIVEGNTHKEKVTA